MLGDWSLCWGVHHQGRLKLVVLRNLDDWKDRTKKLKMNLDDRKRYDVDELRNCLCRPYHLKTRKGDNYLETIQKQKEVILLWGHRIGVCLYVDF